MFIRTVCLYLEYLKNRIKYRKNIRFRGYTVLHAFPGSAINISKEGCCIVNSHPLSNLVGLFQRTIIVARYGGIIRIGHHCGISGSTIYAMDRIEIGDNVLIGGNCKIIDNDFHPLQAEKRLNQKPDVIKKAPIVIGDGCFIGANSIILKGTALGKNCVVGAGSVVHGIFPDNVIIAGNPAKIIKEIEEGLHGV